MISTLRCSAPLLVLGLVTLAGCTTMDSATEDHTALAGEVPDRLGRILVVAIEGADEETQVGLLEALREEFLRRDLFDHVLSGGESEDLGRTASTLQVSLRAHTQEEVFDLFDFSEGYVVRDELDVELRALNQQVVLKGHVTGIGADTVTDLDALDVDRRKDVQIAALHDVGMKLSRGLRLAADRRAREAFESIQTIALPPGVSPVQVAVLGFDEARVSQLRRGPILAEQLTRAILALGPDFTLAPTNDIRRAVDRLPRQSFFGFGPREIGSIAGELPARVFVLGKITATGERIQGRLRAVDRQGVTLVEKEAEAVGLGALRVVAAELGKLFGEGLLNNPPPPSHELPPEDR